MTLSWWGSTLVAVLLLCLVAVGFSAWCARMARAARDEAAAARRQAERVASWCGIPQWWVPQDRWPQQRPPADRATIVAMRAAAAAEPADTAPLRRYRPLTEKELGGGEPR